MSTNPLREYAENFRANLPSGVTYDSTTARYFYNGKRFNNEWEVERYRNYILKFDNILAQLKNEVANLGGVLYAPPGDGSDWLFQTTTGETVSAASDPVGLMLDVSEGARKVGSNWQALGPELITNGTFDTDLTGWNLGSDPDQVTVTWNNGAAQLTRGSGGDEGFTQSGLSVSGGLTYLIQLDVLDGLMVLRFDGKNFPELTAGSHQIVVTPRAPTDIEFWPQSTNTSGTIDNISVRELPGDHATQSVSASRPTVGVEWDGKGALGPELVTNGTFDTNVDGWSAVGTNTGDDVSFAWNAGKMRVSRGADNIYGAPQQLVTVEVGKAYRGTVSIEQVAGSDPIFRMGTGPQTLTYTQISSVGEYAFDFVAQSENLYISIWTGNNSTHDFDNISVREIPAAGVRVYLDCDGTDDHLTTSVTPNTSGALLAAFRADASSAGVDVIAGGMGSSDGRAFLGVNAGVLVGGVGAVTESTLVASTDLRGDWAVGAVRWDGSTLTLWEDGAQVDTATASGAPDDTIGAYFGSLNNNGSAANYLLGDIAVAAIIPTDPTDAQMARIMNLMGQIVGTV